MPTVLFYRRNTPNVTQHLLTATLMTMVEMLFRSVYRIMYRRARNEHASDQRLFLGISVVEFVHAIVEQNITTAHFIALHS